MSNNTALATLAGGCFWCVEAAYKEVPGVESATSGYAGGHVDDPSYKEVTSGNTGHAECVQIEYDPSELGYEEVLGIFFTIHDPTQLNRQGPDVGTQYRSAIFTHDESQQETAEAFIEALQDEDAYDDEIVTEVTPLDTFWEADPHHQDYYEKNPSDGYCSMYAEPKVQKVKKQFATTAED